MDATARGLLSIVPASLRRACSTGSYGDSLRQVNFAAKDCIVFY
jgi:hypothetical protein